MLLNPSILSYASPVSWNKTPRVSSCGLESLKAIEGFASASKYLLPADSYWFTPWEGSKPTVFKDSELHLAVYLLMQVGADK